MRRKIGRSGSSRLRRRFWSRPIAASGAGVELHRSLIKSSGHIPNCPPPANRSGNVADRRLHAGADLEPRNIATAMLAREGRNALGVRRRQSLRVRAARAVARRHRPRLAAISASSTPLLVAGDDPRQSCALHAVGAAASARMGQARDVPGRGFESRQPISSARPGCTPKLRYPDMDALSREQGLTVGRLADCDRWRRPIPAVPASAIRVTVNQRGWLDEMWLCLDKALCLCPLPGRQRWFLGRHVAQDLARRHACAIRVQPSIVAVSRGNAGRDGAE